MDNFAQLGNIAPNSLFQTRQSTSSEYFNALRKSGVDERDDFEYFGVFLFAHVHWNPCQSTFRLSYCHRKCCYRKRGYVFTVFENNQETGNGINYV